MTRERPMTAPSAAKTVHARMYGAFVPSCRIKKNEPAAAIKSAMNDHGGMCLPATTMPAVAAAVSKRYVVALHERGARARVRAIRSMGQRVTKLARPRATRVIPTLRLIPSGGGRRLLVKAFTSLAAEAW